MKAIVHYKYGPTDVLELRDLEQPVVDDESVLVRVRAASVNPLDWHFMRGLPYGVRVIEGRRKPKSGVLGFDVAGQVEAVGQNVAQFRPGDAVFGVCRGAFAEFVRGGEKAFAPKPANLTFEQAAAVPVAGCTALQGLRDRGQLRRDQKVLIVGAAGGVGTFAVQIAKAFGAEVTGVCSTRNVDMVRSIGADRVIDYTQEDFTEGGKRFDLILDMAGTCSLSACRRALTSVGTYVMVGGPSGRWIAPMDRAFRAVVLSWFVRQRFLPFLTKPNQADLIVLKEFIESGRVTPVIDQTYPLDETPEAVRYLEEGHARGKVVIRVQGGGSPL